MESGEMNNFMKIWLCVVISLSYCYAIGKIIPKGTARLLCLLPVVCLYVLLPLNLSSLHLGGATAFFIAWLGNFKLLLFAFGKGPLSPPLSLLRFLAVACLPIKILHNPTPKSHPNGLNKENPSLKKTLDSQNKEIPGPVKPKKGQKSPINYAIKFLLLALLLRAYDYSEYIHPTFMLVLYCGHVYFCLEIILAMVAALARAMLGLELEQQFNEPYLSTSLQDFWGRRWNIMVTSILRPTVYEPVLNMGARLVGRKWAPLPAVFGSFVVSAVMHELIFYYLGRVRPTWEITWFFLLHGGCLMAEIALKKTLRDKLRLPTAVSTPLTIGFIMVTGSWLFFPQLLRIKADERALEEYAALGAFFKNVSALAITTFQFQL
ncbi:Wax synthase domain - like 5 [Theobroma cacao]|uniref:Acyl-CoA--sterol O-acyltransferase 1 n=2 Tax=Theobroma cacao TaxID=3641 RepID=A0AB32V2H7_THECC|nr:PREDICTED: acyl-CoA--sterol O-acyltransferase 1 [Theobroma cacao]EOY28880.1 Acyl-CoA sterol acyl transferase 1, putative [Theobroma cacao]WRX26174.1 Wax synthase domain - like 5 [Theobroma cacao]